MHTILLVEDDEALAYAFARQFRTAGYEVLIAGSSMDALSILDSDRHVDLFLADVVTPQGQPNGFALGRMAKMKRLGILGIKVIFITGHRDWNRRPIATGQALLQAG